LAENTRAQPDIFERLRRRGVAYEQVMRVVQFDLPQNLFFFARQYGNRTINEVLKRIQSWKQFLQRDFLLTDDQRSTVAQWIRLTESQVWATIRDANFVIGDWVLSWGATPPGENADGERVMSAIRVTATNRATGEKRRHEIPGQRPGVPPAFGEEYQEAFKALGLLDQLGLGAPGPSLISRRSDQGWPVYARMIPRLYDLLAPKYPSRGHYSAQIDLDGMVKGQARYPKELLGDMLEILRMHHPHVFGKTTTSQVKAAVMRHLSGKARQGKPTL